jgi:hypothetical protein
VWSIDKSTSESGSTSSQLAGFSLPTPVSELVVDSAERFFFATTTEEKGEIYLMKMYQLAAEKQFGQTPISSVIGNTQAVQNSFANMITVGYVFVSNSRMLWG